MSCGCKKKNQPTTQSSSNIVVTETKSTNDVQEISLIDQEQIDRLVKKIEEINNSTEK